WQNEAKDLLGTDVTRLLGYNPNGELEPFGSGRRFLVDPTITRGRAWERFEKGHRVYHDMITRRTIQDTIESILGGGGKLIPTKDKVRYGIYWWERGDGMSPGADMSSGGADYIFTRIGQGTPATLASGNRFVWRSRLLARLDAISYSHDAYGRTIGDYVLSHRRNGIDGWKRCAVSGGNETIFKGGLSIFDPNFEALIVSDDRTKREIIEIFRRHGYLTWPDGRRLEDVIVTTTEARQRQWV
ncbi:MAG: hypothetical protein ABIN58_12710, partial [candidate division WOR-3 bacterium]